TGFQPYKFAEVVNYHVDGKLGSGTGAFIITKKRYDALPDDARKILDDNSGEAESRRLGKFWDGVADEAREETRKLPGHKIDKLAPDVEARWTKITKPMVDEWAQKTIGGEKVLATFRQLVAQAKRETTSAR